MPITLHSGVAVNGVLDTAVEQADYFTFNAVAGGTYTLELTGDIMGSDPWMSLLDRNASDELWPSYEWNWDGDLGVYISITLEWTCETSGTYFIELVDLGAGGSYQIKMTADEPSSNLLGTESPDFNGDVWS